MTLALDSSDFKQEIIFEKLERCCYFWLFKSRDNSGKTQVSSHIGHYMFRDSDFFDFVWKPDKLLIPHRDIWDFKGFRRILDYNVHSMHGNTTQMCKNRKFLEVITKHCSDHSDKNSIENNVKNAGVLLLKILAN